MESGYIIMTIPEEPGGDGRSLAQFFGLIGSDSMRPKTWEVISSRSPTFTF